MGWRVVATAAVLLWLGCHHETGPKYIGTATMNPDGTIVLYLRAERPGVHGDGQLVYRPDNKDYGMVLEHLGGMKPGETKPVPPWPDASK